MKSCPNFSDPEIKSRYDAIANDPDLGNIEAMREFLESEKEQRPMGTPAEVKEKLRVRYMPKSEEAELATDAEQTARVAQYIGDPTLTDSNTNSGIVYLNNPVNTTSLDPEILDRAKASEVVTKLSRQLQVPFAFVTAEQAKEITKDSRNPYSNLKGKAFFYQGTVYFVGNSFTTATLLHEFSHPIVKSILKSDPELFDKLYQEALAAEPSLFEDAVNEYSDLRQSLDKETDPEIKKQLYTEYENVIKEEVIVKALTKSADLETKNLKPTTAFGRFMKNLLFAIRQFLRKVFGKGINASKITASTSIADLAKALAAGKNFDIDTSVLTKDDIVRYIDERDQMLKDIASMDEKQIAILSTNAYNVAKSQIRLFIQNKNYKALAELLTDEYKRGDLQEIMKNLKKYAGDIEEKAEKLLEDLERMQNNSIALVNTMYRLDKVFTHIDNQLKEMLKKQGDPSADKDNLHQAYYFGHILNSWMEYIGLAKKTMQNANVDKSSPVYAMILRMEQTGKDAESKQIDLFKNGAGQVLWEELSDMAETIDQEFKDTIANLKKKKASQLSIDKRFKEYYNLTESDYNRMLELEAKREREGRLGYQDQIELEGYKVATKEGLHLTREKVDMALMGQLKDANYLNNFLQGYMYSTDPVIGGFASYFKKNMTEVQVIAQNKVYDFVNELQPLMKEAGVNHTNIGQLGRDIGFLDTTGGYDKDGKWSEKKVWSLLNRYKNYRWEVDNMNHTIDQLEEIYNREGTKEARENLAKAKSDRSKHLKKYFKQEFVDEFYERDEIFEKFPGDTIGEEARRRRDYFFEEMRKITEPITGETAMLNASEKINQLWKEYRLMHSLYDLNGNLKQGDEKLISERLIEYRDNSRKFYEDKPIPGAFQNAYTNYKFEVEALLARENYEKGSIEYLEEYNKRINKWLKENTSVKITDKFYEERAQIIAKINAILEKLPSKMKEELDFSKEWEKIIDNAYGYRDSNGQPIGTEVPEGRKNTIKNAEQTMIDIRKKWAGYSGLTQKEMARIGELATKKKTTGRLTKEEGAEYIALLQKKDKLGLNQYDKADLYEAFEELAELQTKEPTEYYLDAFNYQLDKLDIKDLFDQYGIKEATVDNVDFIISTFGESFMEQSEDFKKWFENNHVRTEKYNKETDSMEPVYKRLYVWSVTKPLSKEYYESTDLYDENGNYETTIDAVPSRKYTVRVVKKEFRTGYNPNKENADGTKGGVELVVGVHIDNKGNFLPKDIEGSPYRNEAYYELKEKNPKLFAVLEKITETHLEWQKGSPRGSKLYMDFPRFEMSDLEFAQRGLLKKKAQEKLSFLQMILQKIRNFFKGSAADMETGLNLNAKNQWKLVQTDMFDNKIHKIPIAGLYNLDAETEVSTDIITSMSRYMYSAETQKKLIELNPVAQAIKKVLSGGNQGEALREIDQVNKQNAKAGIFSFAKKEGRYVREEQFNAFYDTFFLAQNNAGFGANEAWIQNTTNFMFGKAANSFFALNIPSALKNSFGAKFQALIMSAAGRFFNLKDYAIGEAWAAKTMAKVSFNVYNGKTTDLDLLMLETFDPSQGRTQSKIIGNQDKPGKITRTLASDIMDRSWLVNVRKWTELQSTLAAFGAMMHKQKIKKEDGSEIPYSEAFEVKDGRLVLKQGIDPKWGITYTEDGKPILGSEFVKFRNKMHMVMNKLVGAVSKYDQPDAKRYLLYRMVSFMKGYFTEMAMNRFGKKRRNIGLSTTDEGYYVTAVKSFVEAVQTKSWVHMGPREREAFIMTATEIGGLILMYVLAHAMFGGFDPDDPDKYAKLRKKAGVLPFPFVGEGEADFNLGGFLEVHSMLLMMQIESENRQFLDPRQLLPMFTDLKSIAFGPTLNMYASIGSDIIYLLTGSDKAYYERRTGPYEWQQEGGLKMWNHIAKMYGINAASISPVDALKGWQSAQQLSSFR